MSSTRLLMLIPLLLAWPAFTFAQSLDVEPVRTLPVQHNGRIPPLDTLARDMVETVTGTMHYQGQDPVRVLLGWTFDPDKWMREPLIVIGNSSLRAALQLPADQTAYSYLDLVQHDHLMDLIDELARRLGRKQNDLEAKVSGISERLSVLQQAFNDQIIPLVPDPKSVISPWRTISEVRPGESDTLDRVRAAWQLAREAYRSDNASEFSTAAGELRTALSALPSPYRPSAQLVATELRYNQWQPYRIGWQGLLTGTILAVLAALLAAVQSGVLFSTRRALDVLAVLAILAGCGALTYGLGLRWHIAGRLPAANMYESLLFLSWGAAAFAIVAAVVLALTQRGRVITVTASAMGTLALMLADLLPIDHYIRPIAPVLLDTVWMSIHVPVIMVSYAVLAVAVAIAHGQLVMMAFTPFAKRAIETLDRLHYWYAFVGAYLLLAGIITGSMWGAASWGRYWGWDPKEVWSLVAFLAYMVILHVKVDHERVPGWTRIVALALGVGLFAILALHLQPLTPVRSGALGLAAVAAVIFVTGKGAFATALKSILAFWLIIMTYVGVNYVLGIGLHSYAFGKGAVVRYLFLTGSIDLALIMLCTVIYLIGAAVRKGSAGGEAGQPVPSGHVAS